MFDLYYFSFNVIDQVHQAELPGILVSPPIKKGSRTREGDLLILFLSIAGKNPYSADELDTLLQRSALSYYRSSGSLTAGMRAAADTCNSLLLERNLKSAREEGSQAIGRLNMAVLRDDTLFLAVAGPSHAFVLNASAVEDFYDPQAGRGLGAGTAVSLRYFQSRLQVGDVLVFSPEPPLAWTAANLAGSPSLTLEHLRRRLLNGIAPNLQAVVFKFQSGPGEIHPLRHRSTAIPATPMAHSPAPESAPAVKPISAASTPGERLPQAPVGVTTTQPVSRPAQQASSPPAPTPLEMSEEEKDANRSSALEEARQARLRRLKRKQKIASVWAGWKNFTGGISRGWQGLLSRLTPHRTARGVGGEVQAGAHVSPALLIFIAIAVPLIIVAISLTVYLQTGRGEQHENYYQQAIALAEQALSQKDPLAQRSYWMQVLEALDNADKYGITDESRELRRRAQQGVDTVDSITRLDFKPVSRVNLPSSVQATRMAASGDDLYLLDSSKGSILRLFLTAQGYELDNNFKCGPGPSGLIFIRPLVDLAIMPPVNQWNATVAAVDDSGNLIYCVPSNPIVTRPLAAPNIGWGRISSIALVQDSLYILDVLANAVWKYTSQELFFQERPTLFSEPFNLSLANTIDLAFYDDYVFFLRQDGTVTRCTISKVKDLPTRCEDPVRFIDNRMGRERNPKVMPDTSFTQMQSITAPDPSLYLLDSKSSAIYRFSVVMNFQEQMRPSGLGSTPLPQREPTAFTIATRRMAVLAYGNQLFMAQMP